MAVRRKKAVNRRWIQSMGPLKKGALHRDLGVPMKKKIPYSMLKAAAKRKGVVGRRARLALTFRRITNRRKRRSVAKRRR
jgi:hypothetical protein